MLPYNLYCTNDFPPLCKSDDDGLLAIGGDLSIERLLEAYGKGIFPWPFEEMLMWYSPLFRYLIKTNEIYISKSMRKLLRNKAFRVTFDRCFTEVMQHCANVYRHYQYEQGTWISEEFIQQYTQLYYLGIAHSVEVWNDENRLVGGLYGLELGKIFVGESMFTLESNASKYGLIVLSDFLHKNGIDIIDCQTKTDHLMSLGAFPMPRHHFVQYLQSAIQCDNISKSNWQNFKH